jgi:formate dehydrogenase subunit gamma
MNVFEAWNADRASELIASHAGQDGPLLPILHDLQATFGSIPDAAVVMVAQALSLTPPGECSKRRCGSSSG